MKECTEKERYMQEKPRTCLL